ncbi:hypothetical protein Ahy_B08g092504 isoform B [Arachis hypogaea]|uniref:Uncharacterized protein n=1 Tax=Arachis hypogaea TaxID=3818 RepID=A0A444Y3X8_ARAHY|nr:hypothetical protein Ahy_B08g092504 isoform B [Arachis hypogaea]
MVQQVLHAMPEILKPQEGERESKGGGKENQGEGEAAPPHPCTVHRRTAACDQKGKQRAREEKAKGEERDRKGES